MVTFYIFTYLCLRSFDVRAEKREFLFKAFIPTVEMIDPRDFCYSLCRKTGKDQWLEPDQSLCRVVHDVKTRLFAGEEDLLETKLRTLVPENLFDAFYFKGEPLDGKLDSVKKLLFKLFDHGVVAFYCGHGPYLLRMLPPLMAMETKHIDEVCEIISQSLQELK